MPDSLKELIRVMSFLPGIGEKTATKLAYFLLQANKNYVDNFSNSLQDLHDKIDICPVCGSFVNTGEWICRICAHPNRKKNLICVVEEYLDLVAIENLGIFDGVYHVLWGTLSPIQGIFASDLNFETLFSRIADGQDMELIIATNPNIQWEAAFAYIVQQLESRWLRHFLTISRPSRWLSSGYLEYADNMTLIHALRDRKIV